MVRAWNNRLFKPNVYLSISSFHRWFVLRHANNSICRYVISMKYGKYGLKMLSLYCSKSRNTHYASKLWLGLKGLQEKDLYLIFSHQILNFLHLTAFLQRGHDTERPSSQIDAGILVGGCESSAASCFMQNASIRWSHKHWDCSRLPLTEQHRQAFMWPRTSWYHRLLILLWDFIRWCLWTQDMELKWRKSKPVDVVGIVSICFCAISLAERRE